MLDFRNYFVKVARILGIVEYIRLYKRQQGYFFPHGTGICLVQLAWDITMAETSVEEVGSVCKGRLRKMPGLLFLTDTHKNQSSLMRPAFNTFFANYLSAGSTF